MTSIKQNYIIRAFNNQGACLEAYIIKSKNQHSAIAKARKLHAINWSMNDVVFVAMWE